MRPSIDVEETVLLRSGHPAVDHGEGMGQIHDLVAAGKAESFYLRLVEIDEIEPIVIDHDVLEMEIIMPDPFLP